jgi:hypothetical protein
MFTATTSLHVTFHPATCAKTAAVSFASEEKGFEARSEKDSRILSRDFSFLIKIN